MDKEIEKSGKNITHSAVNDQRVDNVYGSVRKTTSDANSGSDYNYKTTAEQSLQ